MKHEKRSRALTVAETEHRYVVTLDATGFTRDDLAVELGALELHIPRCRGVARHRLPVTDEPRGVRWAEPEAADAHAFIPVGLGRD